MSERRTRPGPKGMTSAEQIATEMVWNGPERPPIYLWPRSEVRLGDLFRVVKIEADSEGQTVTLEHITEPGS